MLSAFFAGLSWTRIAIALTVAVGIYATGYVRGETSGATAVLRAQVAELETAAAESERLRQIDAAAVAQSEQDRAALEILLKQVLNAQPQKTASFRFDSATLRGLCQLAGAPGGDCAQMPGTARRSQK